MQVPIHQLKMVLLLFQLGSLCLFHFIIIQLIMQLLIRHKAQLILQYNLNLMQIFYQLCTIQLFAFLYLLMLMLFRKVLLLAQLFWVKDRYQQQLNLLLMLRQPQMLLHQDQPILLHLYLKNFIVILPLQLPCVML